MLEIILFIATNPIIYRKRKLMIIFTIAYEIHMRVLLITLDIELSITGTT